MLFGLVNKKLGGREVPFSFSRVFLWGTSTLRLLMNVSGEKLLVISEASDLYVESGILNLFSVLIFSMEINTADF